MITRTTKRFREEGLQCVCCNASHRLALAPQFPMTGNVTLLEAIAFVRLGKSTAYKYGVIPEYDENGERKNTEKAAPPFPWLPMPDSIIRNEHGRKLFCAEEIRAWRDAMRARSRQGVETNGTSVDTLAQHEDC